MFLHKKLAVALLLSSFSLPVLADADKTHVDIAIDSTFKDKNIVFTVETPGQSPETVGFYQAGDPLAMKTDVAPIVDSKGSAQEQQVLAYVSDATSRQTCLYQSKNGYIFSEDALIGLSFPAMFMCLC